jgi:predicted cytidylate kinase
MLITISGPSGSGKSSVAKVLSEKLGLPTVDVGRIFRRMAKEKGMSVGEFGRYAEKHKKLDEELDERVIRMARRRKDLILQSRLAGLMTARYGMPAVRIWIDASTKTRAARISRREGRPAAQILKETTRRDMDNLKRYKQTYGLDLNDRSVYDIVVKTDDLTINQVVASLLKSLKPIWPKKRTAPPPPQKKRSRAPHRRQPKHQKK